jgi:hypothetical protein
MPLDTPNGVGKPPVPRMVFGLELCAWATVSLSYLWVLCGATFVTVDEVAHLPAGVSHWQFRRFDFYRVNPPLVRLACTVHWPFVGSQIDWVNAGVGAGYRPEFYVGVTRLSDRKLRLINDYYVPRMIASLFAVAGLAFIFSCIYFEVGRPSAHVAAAFWCFSPDILAHGPTIGPDIGSVAFGLLACFTLRGYGQTPSLASATTCGVGLGLANLTKLTWLTGFVTFPVAVLIARRVSGSHGCRWRSLCHLMWFWVVAVFIINVGYLFEDSCLPLGKYSFCSERLGGVSASPSELGNVYRDTWLGRLPVPFPRNFVLGIDYLKHEVEGKMWSFLNGEWKFGSWPHYYVLTTLYKTPEPTLLGTLIGLGVLIAGIRRRMVKPEVISMFLFLIIPAAVCFSSVSLQGGFNHHHRYVLMIYPPMFALAAYIASPVGVKLLRFRLPLLGPKKRSIAVPLAVALVTLSAASSLRVHPHYTSYFNTISGGPGNGWRLLGSSNIAWGQDILEVDKWLKDNPDKRPVVMDIDYFGMNGNLFDIETSDPPKLPKGASINDVRSSITETQWWIISVKKLYNLPGHPGIEYLQQIEPVEKIAYAYHVYRIDPLPKAHASPEHRTP